MNGLKGMAVTGIMMLVQLIFAGYSIVVNFSLNDYHVDPLVFSLYRDVGASIVLLTACLLMGEQKPVPRSDRLLFLGVGLFGITITQTGMVVALQFVKPFNASLMQPSQPVLTLLLAIVLRMETINLRSKPGLFKVAGIVIGCAGATFTVLTAATGGDDSNSHNMTANAPPAAPPPAPQEIHPILGMSAAFTGNAILLFQCIGGAFYQLMNKRLTGRYPSITVSAYGYCVGTIMLLVVVLPVHGVKHADVWSKPLEYPPIFAVLYAVFLASAFNYFAYAWAARRSTASHVTAFFPLQVVFTAILQIIFLHVPPTPAQLGGAAMIVLALFCIVASLAYESKADTESPKVLVEESAHDGPSESDLPSPARAF